MKRKKLPATSYWPGYVDALVNVVLNVLFFVGLMAVGLVTINIEALSSYKGAKQAQDLRNISEGHMLLAALGTLLAAIPLPTDNQPKPKAQAEPPPPAPKVEVATSAAPASKEARNFKATDISDRINSAVFSVGTANDERHIPAPILNRMNVWEIAPPSVDEARGIASRMCGSILSQHHWGRFFQAELGDEVLDQLARMPPRDMRRSLMTAFGNARLARRDRLLGVDLPDRGPQRQRMGFMA
jgi:hypothetical protein